MVTWRAMFHKLFEQAVPVAEISAYQKEVNLDLLRRILQGHAVHAGF